MINKNGIDAPGVKLTFILAVIIVSMSSFLLFQVQPLISKHILPWYGGSSSVWTVAMLFFMTLLLAGYTYAHFVVRLNKRAPLVHGIVLVITLFILVITGLLWRSPITPGVEIITQQNQPLISVLLVLLVSVGLPYFALSTTSSLLQHWLGSQYGSRAYKLYAVSNSAALLALLTYPVIFEPWFSTWIQGWIWAAVFVVYVVFFIGFLFRHRRQHIPHIDTLDKKGLHLKTGMRVQWRWVALPALSAALLLSSTSLITQQVAPIPFLWILPLAIYLLTFIITFQGENWYVREWSVLFCLLTSFLGLFGVLQQADHLPLTLQLLVFSLTLFFACYFCHGELYRVRPKVSNLTQYYLFISVGSTLGAIMVAIIAPLIFPYYWEYSLVLFALSILSIKLIKQTWFASWSRDMQRAVTILLVAALASLVGWILYFQSGAGKLEQIRNFYGVVSVYDIISESKIVMGRTMMSGGIEHGNQVLVGGNEDSATSYFSTFSGAGAAISELNKQITERGMRVGVIGLGVGTMAAYCESGDDFTFYEINPVVTEMAQKYFTYLSRCRERGGKVSVLEGDARLVMEEQLAVGAAQNYDLLVVDAFTDDAIPAHLLTREAMQIYLNHMAKDGVMAFHISNRFVGLAPVINGLANEYRIAAMLAEPDEDTELPVGVQSSSWVLLTNNSSIFTDEILNSWSINTKKLDQEDRSLLWTDDYSNLFTVFQWK